MLARLLVTLLIVCFLAPAGLAAETLREAAKRHGRELAAQATTGAKNPYKVPALGLIAGGGALLVIGLMQDRGVEVGTNTTGTAVSAKETGGSKTALTAIGAIAAASGAGLWFWGEQKKNSPQISATPRSVSVSLRF